MTDKVTVPTATGSDKVAHHTRTARERALILDVANRIIPAIGRYLPATTEIVLHDLTRLPNSIVAVWGNVTDRRLGDPSTDLLLENVMQEAHVDLIGYRTYRQDGRQLQSSTIILRDGVDAPVGALCVNSDISPWITLQKVAERLVGGASPLASVQTNAALDPVSNPLGKNQFENVESMQQSKEVLPTDVKQLASHLIESAIRESGMAVDAMRKEHKVEVVRILRHRGIFLLRDAAEIVAKAIKVSRFTVYNYLKEFDDEGEDRTT